MDGESVELLMKALAFQLDLLQEIRDELRAIRQATEAQEEEECGATHLGDMSGSFVAPQSLNGHLIPPCRNPVLERE